MEGEFLMVLCPLTDALTLPHWHSVSWSWWGEKRWGHSDPRKIWGDYFAGSASEGEPGIFTCASTRTPGATFPQNREPLPLRGQLWSSLPHPHPVQFWTVILLLNSSDRDKAYGSH